MTKNTGFVARISTSVAGIVLCAYALVFLLNTANWL
jgi:hypothetical protein